MIGARVAVCLVMISTCLCLAAFGRPAQPVAVFTIVEGEPVVVRDLSRLAAGEGVRLLANDIVETAAKTGLADLEFSNGGVLELGPGARVWVQPRWSGERGRPQGLYILEGWVKLTAPRGASGASALNFASPVVDVLGANGVVVSRIGRGEAELFLESGEARLVERRDGKPGIVRTLKAGDYFSYKAAGGNATVAPRPAAAMLEQLPPTFRDTLPALAARFKDRDVPARPLRSVLYADIEAWLKGEPALRHALLRRWRPLANDPQFRSAVVSNMSFHPEWDRVLFPEKYAPKPPAVAADGGVAHDAASP